MPDATRRTGVAELYWRGIGEAVGASDDLLAQMQSDFWDEYCGVANEELLEYLRGLRETVGLAILSNSGDGAREEEERRFGFSDLFDPICYSHEIGVTKPDRDAFRIALTHMDASPNDVLFIDNVGENTDAAAELGVRAHLHVDTKTTIRAIELFLDESDVDYLR
ncbi:HAD-IA family hydrolase [Leifsonia soli]|uniref:Putative hydrolase of the HAD superfamily n=1 Tax=Leifsonia soli TaxID=582665 RepID=A0A852SZR9_9MICO|nr:HAD-IA family hydrolase [Leifsonia soli]NYD74185.1 putative hydrolase of the HAD superfamily [Leifsonia soli]